jgi:hypothetical protein
VANVRELASDDEQADSEELGDYSSQTSKHFRGTDSFGSTKKRSGNPCHQHYYGRNLVVVILKNFTDSISSSLPNKDASAISICTKNLDISQGLSRIFPNNVKTITPIN